MVDLPPLNEEAATWEPLERRARTWRSRGIGRKRGGQAPLPDEDVERSSCALDIEPGVLEVEVAAHTQDDVAADGTGSPEVVDRSALGVEQLAPQALVRL